MAISPGEQHERLTLVLRDIIGATSLAAVLRAMRSIATDPSTREALHTATLVEAWREGEVALKAKEGRQC